MEIGSTSGRAFDSESGLYVWMVMAIVSMLLSSWFHYDIYKHRYEDLSEKTKEEFRSGAEDGDD